MIDRAAIFEGILRKNELRRSSGLPEWPVRETYAKSVRNAAWREYIDENSARVHAEVLARQREKMGADYPQSFGGRLGVACLVNKALAEGFLALRPT